MPVTRLSPTATPGRNYSFSAKTAAAGKGTGPFTELSVTATPGRIHSFSAKTAAGGGDHTGEFTELSVTATPGRRHSFSAKAPAIPVGRPGGGGGALSRRPAPSRTQILRDDQEVLDLIAILYESSCN